ncbi:transposase [Mycobacterium intracellulare subsp. yongonense]|nr:transposase [Mycobacterium intracellulare subsp. yongonense]
MVPSLANGWSHAHGKTGAELAPCPWQPTVPEVFGPWQTIWTWHRRLSEDGTWDVVLARLLTAAQEAGIIDWAVAVDSTIARAHQHATNVTRHTGGWVELQESPRRAA